MSDASSAATRSWRCDPGAVKRALDELRGQGGVIAGSESEGTVSVASPVGEVTGRYRYDGEHFTVTVTRKPSILPLEMIWSRIEAICGPPVMPA